MSKPRQGFRRLVSRAVGVPILLLAVLAVVLLWQVGRLTRLSETVEHTDRIIADAHRIETVLLELQVATRGFLITGDRRFLDDFTRMFPDLREATDRFAALVAGNAAHAERVEVVRAMQDEWLACRDQALDELAAGRSPAGPLVDCGRPAMQELRAILSGMVRDEEAIRNAQTLETQRAARMTLVSGVSLGVIVAALLAVTGRRQLMTLSDRYEDALSGLERQSDAARDSEDRMFGIINSAMDAIITVDEQQRVVVFNATAERIFGWPVAEIVGQPLDLLLPERFRASHRQSVQRFAQTGETARLMGHPGQLLGLRRSGEEFPVEATISQVTIGGARLLTVILRDVTARTEAERALRESEERFRLFVEGVQDYAILMLDPDGCIVAWNPGAERITGYSEADTLGRSIVILYPEHERRAEHMADELRRAREGSFHVEVQRQRKDGTLFWAEVTTTPIFDERGELRGFAKLTRDITERKLAQEHLQRYARELEGMQAELEERVRQRTEALEEVNAELNAFAYSVSHDLRAPLRSMQGFAEALLEDYGDRLDEVGRDYATRVVKASKRMDALIQDLLAYSRVSRTELDLQPVSLEQTVDSALVQLDEPRARAGAEVELGPLDHWVLAHRVTLAQVLANLLSNSIKFVAPGQRPRVRIAAERDGEWVRLVVEDHGIGIPAEHADRIFRVFERLHPHEAYPGTGIGLAIVKKALDRMGGRISLSSAPGHGSRFQIELPASSPGAVLDAAASDAP
jgi:PAS domain S-box-containing protein